MSKEKIKFIPCSEFSQTYSWTKHRKTIVRPDLPKEVKRKY